MDPLRIGLKYRLMPLKQLPRRLHLLLPPAPSYPYVPGSHEPKNGRQLAKIARDLHTLHQIHRKVDIRCWNLVFGCEDEAKLIDFDMARDVGTPYMFCYATENIPERAVGASARMAMQFVHDWESLSKIAALFVDQDDDGNGKQFVQALRDGNVAEAESLQDSIRMYAASNADITNKVVGTGSPGRTT